MFLHSEEPFGENGSRLREWIPLFLRMAVVALLAITLARPVIGNAEDSAAQRICVVMLFDNSAGMQFNEGTAGPRIETARTVALSIANRLQREDEVHFIPLAASNEEQAASTDPADLQSVIAQIADVQVAGGAADVAAGLTVAERLLAQSDAGRKVIVLITSRQAANWRNVSDVFAATFRQQTLPMQASMRMVFIPIGTESSSNVAIDRLMLPPAPIVRGIPESCQLVVHNYGSTDVKALPLELRVVGQRSDNRLSVDLPAGASMPVEITVTFAKTGPHLLLGRIRDSSRIPGGVDFDDQCEAVADVREPLNVDVIAGERLSATTTATTGPLRQSAVVAAALAPFQASGVARAELAHVAVENLATDWADHLTGTHVVVLAGGNDLDAEQAQKIKAFVINGGGLLMLPAAGKTSPLAEELFTSGGAFSPATSSSAPSIPMKMQLTSSGRKALFPTVDPSGLFSGTTLDNVWRIIHRMPDSEVLLQANDHRPVIVSRSLGHGRVALITTVINGTTSLAKSAAIVPLFQSIARYLAGGLSDRLNLAPGEPLDVHLDRALAERATVMLPDNTRQNAVVTDADGRSAIHFANTGKPGRYELTTHGKNGEASTPFIVRAPRDGSDLTPMSGQRLLRLQQLLGMRPMGPQATDEIVASFDRKQARDLWVFGLGLVVFAIIAELWISNRSAGQA